MPIYLAPWHRTTSEGRIIETSPFATTMGCIDMRSALEAEQGTGHGLFETRQAETIPDAVFFADDWDDLVDTEALKREFALGENIVSQSARDVAWEMTTTRDDRGGTPLVPNVNGRRELWICGNLLQWDYAGAMSDMQWQVARASEQKTYRVIYEQAKRRGLDTHRKWLWTRSALYGRPSEEFIPSDLPSETPVRPETTVTDNFNRANENLEASANWSLINGDINTPSLEVFSNECRPDTTVAASSWGHYQTPLSGSDHYAEHVVRAVTAPSASRSWCTSCCRMSANVNGSINGVDYSATIDSGGTKRGRLGKYTGTAVSPLYTTLVDEVETINVGDRVRTETDGSNATGFINDVETALETAIGTPAPTATSDVGIGARITDGSIGDVALDDFEAADLAAAAGRIMASMVGAGGLVSSGGIAGRGGGLAA